MIGAALIQTRRREIIPRQSIAHEKNDAERLLHHPRPEIKKTEGDERQQTDKGKQLIAKFHWEHAILTGSAKNTGLKYMLRPQFHQQIPAFDRVADMHQDLVHNPIRRGVKRGLHFHRFER